MTRQVVVNGNTFHIGGRRRPKETKATHPHLFKSVRDFMKPGMALPAVPTTFSYFSQSAQAQSDILGNDTLGDCTAAGACHLTESWTAAAGAPVVLQVADAIAFYSLSTGYVPGDSSTDQGGDEITVLSTWRDKGLDGNGSHAIVGWLVVDPTNAAEVKQAMYLFENLYFGIELDSSWPQSVSGNGFVWSGGTPNPADGHCIVGGGADTSGITVNSWGFIGTMTYPAIAQFCAENAGGNLFAILTQEVINRAQQKAPTGLDWPTLQAFFASLGGTTTPPSNPPPSQ
jgi:hypothetical protein